MGVIIEWRQIAFWNIVIFQLDVRALFVLKHVLLNFVPGISPLFYMPPKVLAVAFRRSAVEKVRSDPGIRIVVVRRELQYTGTVYIRTEHILHEV